MVGVDNKVVMVVNLKMEVELWMELVEVESMVVELMIMKVKVLKANMMVSLVEQE